ncbi:MAG: YraN family protein, partial [Alphaproteobacteria bacterium]|nr:YraN family protein [Alphaproteobacteria bacterium]
MIAAVLLRLKGYRILARDYRAGVGELDIMARRGRLL